MVAFKECEFTLVNPRQGEEEQMPLHFDTQPDEPDFGALFKIEGESSYLELSDCMVTCEKSTTPVCGFWVSKEGPSERHGSTRCMENSTILWLRSCYLSQFNYGVIAKDNTIINVEKSHFMHIKGAALAATDPIWCKMTSTVVDNCGAHAIAITLTH